MYRHAHPSPKRLRNNRPTDAVCPDGIVRRCTVRTPLHFAPDFYTARLTMRVEGHPRAITGTLVPDPLHKWRFVPRPELKNSRVFDKRLPSAEGPAKTR